VISEFERIAAKFICTFKNGDYDIGNEPILDAYWNQLEAEIDRRKQLDNVTTDIEGIEIENVAGCNLVK
jgi:hypothetical protein